MTSVVIPRFDANMLDVTIVSWRRQVGERVAAGEVLAELSTDKAMLQLEAPAAGTLLAVWVAAKSIVPVGYAVAAIGEAGEAAKEPLSNQELMARYRKEAGLEVASATPVSPAASRPVRIRATPRARRLAAEQGLDLAAIQAATGVAVVDEAAIGAYLANR